MFLDKIKIFWIKKLVKKRWVDVRCLISGSSVKKVGIIFDEMYFEYKNSLVEKLSKNGIAPHSIDVLIYKDKIKKREEVEFKFFSLNDITWKATFNNQLVADFVNKDFDLLISYYDAEKAPLMMVTNLSKAQFKVGFSTINNKLNHLIIDCDPKKQIIFVDELIKYLKILKKI